jgi:hypothetical protein
MPIRGRFSVACNGESLKLVPLWFFLTGGTQTVQAPFRQALRCSTAGQWGNKKTPKPHIIQTTSCHCKERQRRSNLN